MFKTMTTGISIKKSEVTRARILDAALDVAQEKPRASGQRFEDVRIRPVKTAAVEDCRSDRSGQGRTRL